MSATYVAVKRRYDEIDHENELIESLKRFHCDVAETKELYHDITEDNNYVYQPQDEWSQYIHETEGYIYANFPLPKGREWTPAYGFRLFLANLVAYDRTLLALVAYDEKHDSFMRHLESMKFHIDDDNQPFEFLKVLERLEISSAQRYASLDPHQDILDFIAKWVEKFRQFLEPTLESLKRRNITSLELDDHYIPDEECNQDIGGADDFYRGAGRPEQQRYSRLEREMIADATCRKLYRTLYAMTYGPLPGFRRLNFGLILLSHPIVGPLFQQWRKLFHLDSFSPMMLTFY